MRLTVNVSPCPNDTFIFHALSSRLVDCEDLEFEIDFADIEQLNTLAMCGISADVVKISYAVLPQIAGKYALIECGSALGRGNGPLLVRRKGEEVSLDAGPKVAIPGDHTTANALLGRLFPQLRDKKSYVFSDIAQALHSQECDLGVLIHESRFTYADQGLELVADLGLLWEQSTSLPLPLGGIVVSRALPAGVQQSFQRVLRRSIEYALANPSASEEFVAQHAQELSKEVINSHIDMFVNSYTLLLGKEGRRAIGELTGLRCSDILISDNGVDDGL